MQDKFDELWEKLLERLPEELRDFDFAGVESPFDRPYFQITNGVLEKCIADESGVAVIPDGVEVIAAGVFSWDGMPEDQYEYWEAENNQLIDRIHIPASVKEIRPGAFSGVDALNEITVDPMCSAAVMIDGILFSGDKSRAIAATSQMVEISEYCLPDTTTVIDDYAFANRRFQHLIIPDSVKSIGDHAFDFCRFESITIPGSVNNLGEGAFNGCRFDYKSVIISENNPVLKKNEFGLFSKDGETLLTIFFTLGEYIEIPRGVKSIGSTAFLQVMKLKEVSIPEGVVTLPDGLFFWKGSLERVVLPDSVLSIGEDAFTSCDNLTEIRMSANLKEIQPYAFNGCKKLEVIVLPDTLKSIGENAFMNCKKLVIHAPAGSYAISYAKENGIAFKEI